jgi:sugar (pentulose or hexulose) kinase
VILTVDLGTSVTKVVVWGAEGQLAVGRSALDCTYSAGNRAEQDPASWWPSVVSACESARAALGASAVDVFGAIEAVGFSAARQTFVPVAEDATPLGPALLWSDRRAHAEAVALAESFEDRASARDDNASVGEDGARFVRRRTGLVLDAGSVAAKLRWLENHEPQRLERARWLLAPRDLVASHLTGAVSTDHTLASATGLYEMAGDGGRSDMGPLLPGLVDDAVAEKLPGSLPSDAVLGGLLLGPAGALGVRPGIPVVIGAGDRACEVLGTSASASWPMVSWGTTANVSVPLPRLGEAMPDAMIVTGGALGGVLLEGGLSAAGSLLDWLARLAGVEVGSLLDRARSSPPGSGGVIVLPWLGGARAPWWRDTARGGVVGLAFDHDVGDMARAVIESVAWDVQRCLESATSARAGSTGPVGLVLAGGGSNSPLWTEILAAVTGLPVRRPRWTEAASAGAAMLAARATGADVGLDATVDGEDADPIRPDGALVDCYASLRPGVDAAAGAVIGLGS